MKFGGAVQRINHPDDVGPVGPFIVTLFAQHAVIGIAAADLLPHHVFNRVVDFRHRVVRVPPLVLNVERGLKAGEQGVAGAGGQFARRLGEVVKLVGGKVGHGAIVPPAGRRTDTRQVWGA